MSAQADPDGQSLELRRIIYEQMDYLDRVYTYYRDDLNDNFNPDQPIPGTFKHDGHESHPRESLLRLNGLWRLLKECKVAYGDVKTKLPIAAFNRIVVQGKRRMTTLAEHNSAVEVADMDPHERDIEINFYDWIETLIRSAHVKLQGPISVRFESLIKEYLRPFAMRKQTDKSFMDFRSVQVQDYLKEKDVSFKMRRVFEYFVVSYKSNKLKANIIGAKDITMSFNHVFMVLDRCDLFDPVLNTKKAVELFCKVTLDSDLLPQEHPNNQNSEMVYDEFCEFVMRCAKVKVCVMLRFVHFQVS